LSTAPRAVHPPGSKPAWHKREWSLCAQTTCRVSTPTLEGGTGVSHSKHPGSNAPSLWPPRPGLLGMHHHHLPPPPCGGAAQQHVRRTQPCHRPTGCRQHQRHQQHQLQLQPPPPPPPAPPPSATPQMAHACTQRGRGREPGRGEAAGPHLRAWLDTPGWVHRAGRGCLLCCMGWAHSPRMVRSMPHALARGAAPQDGTLGSLCQCLSSVPRRGHVQGLP